MVLPLAFYTLKVVDGGDRIVPKDRSYSVILEDGYGFKELEGKGMLIANPEASGMIFIRHTTGEFPGPGQRKAALRAMVKKYANGEPSGLSEETQRTIGEVPTQRSARLISGACKTPDKGILNFDQAVFEGTGKDYFYVVAMYGIDDTKSRPYFWKLLETFNIF